MSVALGLGQMEIKDVERPYVSFATETEEDHLETKRVGTVQFVDRHYARVTPRGSKDVQLERVDHWWPKLDQLINTGRMPGHWKAEWQAAFERYLKGQEIPVNGTAIRGWKLIPGAMQERLVQLNIYTVEDLANITAEARQHIGMGAVEMQRRAAAWLEQNRNSEGATIKMSELSKENEILKTSVASLEEKVKALSALVEANKKGK